MAEQGAAFLESITTHQEFMASLVDAVMEYAIYLLDAQGHVRSWNAGAARIKGYAPEEILGQHLSIFYSEEDVAAGRPDANLVAAAADGQITEESWRVRKDGTRFWARVTITAIYDEDGSIAGYTKITRDETARMDLERRHDEVQALREREAVALALHDRVTRRLVDAGLLIHAAMAHVRDDAEAVRRLSTALDEVDGTVRELREVIVGLGAGERPPPS